MASFISYLQMTTSLFPIKLIFVPPRGILRDIGTNAFEAFIGADDVVMIAAMPQRAVVIARLPDRAGHSRFIGRNNHAESRVIQGLIFFQP